MFGIVQFYRNRNAGYLLVGASDSALRLHRTDDLTSYFADGDLPNLSPTTQTKVRVLAGQVSLNQIRKGF